MNVVCLIIAIICFVFAAMLPIGLAFFAASFLPWGGPWFGRA